MGEKNVAIDKHLIVDVFKISEKCWKKQEVDKQIGKTMLQCIALLVAYVNIEQWSVSKMKQHYDICLPTLIQIIYQKDKVYYFNNIIAISIMITMKGKIVDWVDTIFK